MGFAESVIALGLLIESELRSLVFQHRFVRLRSLTMLHTERYAFRLN
jgi:hypothetical protein